MKSKHLILLLLAGALPPTAPAASVGVSFTREADAGNGDLAPADLAGAPGAAQTNWNNTNNAAAGDTSAIAGPSAGALVDSTGAASPMTVIWSGNGTYSTSNTQAGANTNGDSRLMSGYIDAVNEGGTATISLENIPYTSYDVYVYFGSDGNGRTGAIQETSGANPEGIAYSYTTGSEKGVAGFQPEDYVRTGRTGPQNPVANYCVFRGRQGDFFSAQILRGSNNSGFHGVQIVELADTDGDGMPDAWETENQLNPGAADSSTADADQDGVSNLEEYRRFLLPNNRDTDGDGLNDGAESDSGVYTSPADAGSDPVTADTDGDGLNDGAEVLTGAGDPYVTNPLKQDTDDDGFSDSKEIADGSDPVNKDSVPAQNASGLIGINFIGNVAADNGGVPDGQTAGAVPQTGWNNVAENAAAGGPVTLENSTGAASGALVSWTANGVWSVTAAATPADPNAALMQGYLDTSDVSTTTVTVQNIPYLHYNVIVYFDGDATGRAGNYTVTTLGRTAALTNLKDTENWPVAGGGGVFTEAVSRNLAGNYAVFRGLSGGQMVLTATPNTPAAFRAPVNAIQIIGTLDTDNDRMPDDYETAAGFNVNDAADAATDADQDGASNLVEFYTGTDPKKNDTDGDTLLDGAEITAGTDPLNLDSDGDTYTDQVETKTGQFVSETNTGTDPLLADTDGDGLADVTEMPTGPEDAYATDPNKADTDGDTIPDGYEVLTLQTSPVSNTDPALGAARAIGISFRSGAGGPQDLQPENAAGYATVSQRNWNLADVTAAGDTTAVIAPSAGVLVDSAGSPTAATVTWDADGTYGTLNGGETPNAMLMGGYLDNTGTRSTVTLSKIPYSSYDVYVYFGSDVNGRSGTITNTTTGESFVYNTYSNLENFGYGSFVITEDTNFDDGRPSANVAVFRSLTAPAFTVQIDRGDNNSGIHAVQAVNTAAAPPSGDFRITGVSLPGGKVRLTWASEPGVSYTVQWSENLTAWNSITPAVASQGASTQWEDPAAAAGTRRFYRIVR